MLIISNSCCSSAQHLFEAEIYGFKLVPCLFFFLKGLAVLDFNVNHYIHLVKYFLSCLFTNRMNSLKVFSGICHQSFTWNLQSKCKQWQWSLQHVLPFRIFCTTCSLTLEPGCSHVCVWPLIPVLFLVSGQILPLDRCRKRTVPWNVCIHYFTHWD